MKVLQGGSAPAAVLMDRDAELLSGLTGTSEPILHLYDWAGESLTYGYFIKPEELLDMDEVARRGLDLARRPTGGGLLFHLTDLAFSVLVPASHHRFSMNTLQNYAWINRAVATALDRFVGHEGTFALASEGQMIGQGMADFCMASPTRYDIICSGRKVGGAAQRRTRTGLLHQGSICLAATPPELVRAVLKDGAAVGQAMRDSAYPLLGPAATSADVASARPDLRRLLIESLCF